MSLAQKRRALIRAHADVAQLAEHLICNQAVASSILAVSSGWVHCLACGIDPCRRHSVVVTVVSGFRGRQVATRRERVGYPSGQREQTVNLPANAYEGSNPSPTIGRWLKREYESGAAVDSEKCTGAKSFSLAGVAQLVERKPSKLDVAGSSPVSRLPNERSVRGRWSGR
jgi:hypothetical protein